ncbi:hypothetical protein AB4169_02970 [Vibrio lentus]|uniref:hypothetical protein n=1 Tax=Vibrio lentus TaxID=136468 RepID=UPI000C81ABC2|nr:hypothetical protein [Vibrio lentus]PME57332.1 hypothetical protein BCV33_11325 [Vibrio lentus]PMG60013.1 hypothetical protein BCU87_17225 [Vibrio lentus]PMH08705.1 hypothetical protein BCU76_05005 [Vibrio lentus]PMH96024.1 hypothetical protein BCU54_12145 [Vibrio lentus]PMK92809.1 hypothetical protein BCT89_20160 [Vibrio lentus]
MTTKLIPMVLLSVFVLSGCSTGINHVGEPQQFNPDGVMVDEYSLNDYGYGVHIVAEFSEYQGMRSSESGFRGCTNILNNVAMKHATSKGERVTRISWREMKDYGYIDHGRDIITAVMNVNCEYYFDYIK